MHTDACTLMHDDEYLWRDILCILSAHSVAILRLEFLCSEALRHAAGIQRLRTETAADRIVYTNVLSIQILYRL